LIKLQTDLSAIFEAIVDQRLGELHVQWSDDSAVCVVWRRGLSRQTGNRDGNSRPRSRYATRNVGVFHAATSRGSNAEWLTAGGRVLGLTATGETLDAALSRCYAAVDDIHWDGMQYRRDIGRTAAPNATAGG